MTMQNIVSVKQCKKCDRGFIIFLVIGQPNGPLKKKPSKHSPATN